MRTLLTLALVLTFSCQSSPEPKKADPVNAAPGLLVALERTRCFGRCPVYRVEVLSDGLVRFKGEKNVKVTEPVEAKLSSAELTALTERLAHPGFDKWTDYVKVSMTDMPTVVLTYQGATLRHYLGDDAAPPALKQLEDDLDALIGTAKWVEGSGAPLQ